MYSSALRRVSAGLGNMLAAPDCHGEGEQIKTVCNTLGQARRWDEERLPLCVHRDEMKSGKGVKEQPLYILHHQQAHSNLTSTAPSCFLK